MSKILLWIEDTYMLLITFPSAHLLRPTLLHIILEPLLSTITIPSVNALAAVYGPHIMIMSWLMIMFLWSGLCRCGVVVVVQSDELQSGGDGKVRSARRRERGNAGRPGEDFWQLPSGVFAPAPR